jgi:hypothetical protein
MQNFIQLRENVTANSSGFFAVGEVKHEIFSAQFL